jgi:hypothetical protein
MKIKLNTPKKIVLIKEVSVQADTVTVNHTIDNGSSVEAEITFSLGEQSQVQTWTLWDGQDYINIGQWTDEDVIKRLNELIND